MVWGEVASIYDWMDERFERGAFTDSLTKDDQRAFVNHDSTRLLARRTANTLRLSEDSKGLRFEADLPDTSYARDVLASIERGDINGMSIGFVATKRTSDYDVNADTVLHTILRAELIEVSPVTFPAYEGTSVSTRLQEELGGLRKRSREAAAASKDDGAAHEATLRLRSRMLSFRVKEEASL